jgi:H/ACA ribonucleoprotein complex subunit 4
MSKLLPFEKESPELIFKSKIKLGRPKKRSAEELLNFGIIVLDKPKGPKSIHVGNKLRAILEQPKLGHAGTLDPLATGVLPIGLGKAVKLLPVLSKAGKVYFARMHLHGDVSEKELKEIFEKFTGKIVQLPPRISAVARRPREREVFWIEIKRISGRDVWFEVGCEAGTYIRKLCHDIGQELGVGAHMAELRRIQAGPFKIDECVTLADVKKNYKKYLETKDEKYIKKIIVSPESAVRHLPQVYIDDLVIPKLAHGSPVFAPGILAFSSNIKKGDVVAIFDKNRTLLGLGLAELNSDELKIAQKGLAIKTDVVLI